MTRLDVQAILARGGMIPAAWKPYDRRKIYERDKGICGLCGDPVLFEYSCVDHIIPWTRGGSHELDNLQIAHRTCNGIKHDRLPNEYANWPKEAWAVEVGEMSIPPNGVPLKEAADQLGVSVDALRKKIRRGTIDAKKVADRWYIVLPDVQQDDQDAASTPTSQSSAGQVDTSASQAVDRELIDQLRSENAFLRAELEARRSADRELRIIIGRLEQRLALPLGSPDAAQDAVPAADRQPDTAVADDAQEPILSRWQRFKQRIGL